MNDHEASFDGVALVPHALLLKKFSSSMTAVFFQP
jgi:hypothetical protein